MHNRTAFFWRLGALVLIGSLLAWWFYCQAAPALYSLPGVAPFIVCPLCFSLAHNAIHRLPLGLAKVFAWAGGLWLIGTLYSFFAVIAYGIVSLAAYLLGYGDSWQAVTPTVVTLVGCFILAVILRGMWTAFHPVVRTVTVSSPAVTQACKVAFLTDLHFSPILSHGYARRLVRHVNALDADVVLFGGDLIDAHLEFVLRDGAYRELGQLQARLGVFAVYGNHDYFDSSIEKEREAFPVHFLKNERLSLPGGITITGLNDYLHEPVNEVLPPVAGQCNVVVDHEPLRIAAASRAGYDVYLAGHTHGGQFFPVTQIVKRIFPLAYGTKDFGNMTAVVSSGYGFWGMPFRTGPKPEIVVLRLLPAHV